MEKRTHRIITTTFLTMIFICSTFLTVWADGPGDNLAGTAQEDGASRVITAGAEESSSEAAEEEQEENTETGKKGASLGMFTTTGYCGCTKCSGGHNLTYSGTVPKAGHTISADLDVFPIGSRLMIGDVIYTVEDMGSSVNGHWIDIYYDNHEAAVAHGMKTEEVFAVE